MRLFLTCRMSSFSSREQLTSFPLNVLPAPDADDLKEFQKLFRQRWGKDLDDKTALDLATRFLNLFALVMASSDLSKISTDT